MTLTRSSRAERRFTDYYCVGSQSELGALQLPHDNNDVEYD